MDNRFTTKNQALPVVWIIWGAMMGALVVYTFVLPVLRQDPPPAPLNPDLAKILGFIAAGDALVSLVLRQVFLSGFKSGIWNFETVQGVRRFVAGNIVCFALSESIGIFGLVLGALGYSLDLCANFLIGSAVLLMWHMPLAARFQPAS